MESKPWVMEMVALCMLYGGAYKYIQSDNISYGLTLIMVRPPETVKLFI